MVIVFPTAGYGQTPVSRRIKAGYKEVSISRPALKRCEAHLDSDFWLVWEGRRGQISLLCLFIRQVNSDEKPSFAERDEKFKMKMSLKK